MGSELTEIPGIGKTFVQDFDQIGITRLEHLKGASPEELFERLKEVNAADGHATSKNYLFVIRMAVYYADGGRESERLRWYSWKDSRRR